MSRLVLIRGLPGSGKSTLAQVMAGYTHIEADMYFTNSDGEYVFDKTKLKDAHSWCQTECRRLLAHGVPVVVSNTFTCLWEMQPYFEMGTRASVIVARGEFQDKHRVPQAVIDAMRARWEELP